MNIRVWGLVLLSFLAGFSAHYTYPTQLPNSPLSPERASPQDWISENNIHLTSEGVVIDVDNPKWAVFADSNSMDPVLDAGSHGIQIVPTSPDQLEIGDVVTYDLDGRKIIHRIVDIQYDGHGPVFIVKGDNNQAPDAPVRFSQIERVLIAVIY